MKNNIWQRMSGWLRGTFILAFVFLALGLGTLGSVISTGKGYVLPSRQTGDVADPCIMLRLYAPKSAEDKTLTVTDIYLNLGTIYNDPGENVTITLSRGASMQSQFYSGVDLTFENFYGEESESTADDTAYEDALFNWVHYEVDSPDGWPLNTYTYYKLTSKTCDVYINEIVFAAHETDDSARTGKAYPLRSRLIPSNEPNKGTVLPESGEEASKAQGVADSPHIPSMAQSSYFRYTPEEIAMLMTINEMRQGDKLTAGVYHFDREGKTYYFADTVYNSLGIDLVVLGTAIFGMSPFGLRFIPFLASFGVLVFGVLFVRKLTQSDKAGFIFALLYALCGMSISLGHLGTPLTLGLCFFMASLYFTLRFFKDGMKKANFCSAVPALLGGLFGAMAICVNGAFVVPMVLPVALFVAGLVRQRRQTGEQLDAAIDEVEASESAPHDDEKGTSEPRKRLGEAVYAHRIKTMLPAALFFAFLLVGTFLISMIAYLPMHATYTRLYGDPLNAGANNLFYFIWKAFSGGFVGENYLIVRQSAWSYFYVLFKGTGDVYAVTAAGPLIAVAALFAGILGMVFALVRLVRHINDASFKDELVSVLLLLCGFALGLVTAAFAQGGLAFILLSYLFLFAFAGSSASGTEEGKSAVAVKVLSWVCLAALVVVFVLFAVFTFSIPTAGFLAGLVA